MKLVLTIEVEHDLLDVPTLLLGLPAALGTVQQATSAGIGATGPNGMQLQVPGTRQLARVGFRLEYAETVERLPVAAARAAIEAEERMEP